MRMTATVSARMSESEAEAFEMLRAKGIRTVDIFRRGLDAYVSDFARLENGTAQNNKKELTNEES